MVSFVIRISIIFLWHVATGDKCYLQSFCDNDQVTAVHPTECEGRDGYDIELTCSFNYTSEALSSDIIYKWQKAGETVENSSDTIKFTPFKHSDAGGYQCKVFRGDDILVFCGQIALTTAPYPRDDCTVNNNGDYNCSCSEGVIIKDHCEDLLTVDIGGYPLPSLSWVVDDVMATNDSQVNLTILPNGSALVDVQLWSLADFKGISIIGHNDVGSVGICVWRSWLDSNFPPPIISFNLSVTPAELKKGASNVTVITCSSKSYVGDFSICYSKNLSDLQRLAVNDEHCCYCSSVATSECSKKFPHWKLGITEDKQTKQFNCRAVLRNVTEDDAGFYQCRVYNLRNYRCKRRYGDIYNYSISTSNDDSSSNSHFSVPVIAVYGVSAALFTIVITIMITLGIIIARWKCRKPSSHSTDIHGSMEDESEREPLLGPLEPSEGNDVDSEEGHEPLAHHEPSDEPSIDNSAQVPVQETGDDRGSTALASPGSQGTRSPLSYRHKAHVIYFGPDTGKWVNSDLTEMLRQMNVEEEYAIAGRFWLSEMARMIQKGCKVIFIVSRDIVTSRFEVMLNQVIFNQNSREPCLIPIMFSCDLNDIDEHLKQLLLPYVLLHHCDNDLYNKLKRAVFEECD